MLIDYIEAAMHRAKYELLADREGFVGQIPGFRGLIGHGHTLEDCREDLHGALQSWLLVKLRHGDRDLPVVDGINLVAGKVRPKARKKHSSQKAA
jgi:predicted RNase H-like HicB family nuclease